MSATLQQGLASLLLRRTEEGRAKALHAIEAWQKAIEAVRQAERMAEHKINLPNEQVQGIPQAAAQVRTANYVQAVYLENQATTARNAIIATASRSLEEETKHRHRLETMARQEIYTAINERDNAITATGRTSRSRFSAASIALWQVALAASLRERAVTLRIVGNTKKVKIPPAQRKHNVPRSSSEKGRGRFTVAQGPLKRSCSSMTKPTALSGPIG